MTLQPQVNTIDYDLYRHNLTIVHNVCFEVHQTYMMGKRMNLIWMVHPQTHCDVIAALSGQ